MLQCNVSCSHPGNWLFTSANVLLSFCWGSTFKRHPELLSFVPAELDQQEQTLESSTMNACTIEQQSPQESSDRSQPAEKQMLQLEELTVQMPAAEDLNTSTAIDTATTTDSATNSAMQTAKNKFSAIDTATASPTIRARQEDLQARYSPAQTPPILRRRRNQVHATRVTADAPIHAVNENARERMSR